MTKPTTAKATTDTPHVSSRIADPVLQELWAVKQRLNKEANYDIKTLLKQAQSAADEFALRKAKHDALDHH